MYLQVNMSVNVVVGSISVLLILFTARTIHRATCGREMLLEQIAKTTEARRDHKWFAIRVLALIMEHKGPHAPYVTRLHLCTRPARCNVFFLPPPPPRQLAAHTAHCNSLTIARPFPNSLVFPPLPSLLLPLSSPTRPSNPQVLGSHRVGDRDHRNGAPNKLCG
jgi:hypothetical protein